MQYLTYENYTAIGGILDETAFNRNITRVCGIIENATHGRLKALYGIPEEVKALCRDMVEYLAENNTTSRTVQNKSQSAGGVSESISFANTTEADVNAHIDGMIYDYLNSVRTKSGVSIIYKGAYDVES